MKIGQLVSFLDAGSIPEQYRAAYQQIVGALQADAPPMPFDTVREVIERELGRHGRRGLRVDRRAPDGGRVDRAGPRRPPARRARGRGQGAVPGCRRRDPGRPGQHRAHRFLRHASAPSSHPSASARTRRPSPRRSPSGSPRSSTTGSRRPTRPSSPMYYRDHPFIRIPEVVPELSTERVLVMDEHDGLRWTAALDQPQDLKDTWGEVINRFVYGSLYDFGAFNADPHPGNYLFHDDGGVSVPRLRLREAVHRGPDRRPPPDLQGLVRRRGRRRRALPVLRRPAPHQGRAASSTSSASSTGAPRSGTPSAGSSRSPSHPSSPPGSSAATSTPSASGATSCAG